MTNDLATGHNECTVKKLSALLTLLIFACFLALTPVSVSAANFTSAYMRANRMAANEATNILVVFQPVTTGTEAKVVITFDTGYTVSATPTVNTSGLPTGVTQLPGTLSAAGVDQVVTITGVTDLTEGTLYGFNIATGITNPTAGSYVNTLTTTTSGDATIDSSDLAVHVLSATNGDQILLTATVPPTFSFTLNGNSDTFSADLSPSSVVSTGGRTVTIATNADKGWIAWVRSANAALASVTSGESILTSGTVNGSPNTLSTGADGYVLDVNLTTDSGIGTGTVTLDGEYNGTDTSSGGTLSTTLQPIATANGTTDGDVLTLIARASISAVKGAANDYTDTLTVVGAGNF